MFRGLAITLGSLGGVLVHACFGRVVVADGFLYRRYGLRWQKPVDLNRLDIVVVSGFYVQPTLLLVRDQDGMVFKLRPPCWLRPGRLLSMVGSAADAQHVELDFNLHDDGNLSVAMARVERRIPADCSGH